MVTTVRRGATPAGLRGRARSPRREVRGAALVPEVQVEVALRALLISARASEYSAAAALVDAFMETLDEEAARQVAAQLALFPQWYRRTADFAREPLEHFLLETTWSRL